MGNVSKLYSLILEVTLRYHMSHFNGLGALTAMLIKRITYANTCDNLCSYTIVLKCAGSCDSDVVLVIVIITLYPEDILALYFTLFR